MLSNLMRVTGGYRMPHKRTLSGDMLEGTAGLVILAAMLVLLCLCGLAVSQNTDTCATYETVAERNACEVAKDSQ